MRLLFLWGPMLRKEPPEKRRDTIERIKGWAVSAALLRKLTGKGGERPTYSIGSTVRSWGVFS